MKQNYLHQLKQKPVLLLLGTVLITALLYKSSVHNGWLNIGPDDQLGLWGDPAVINHDWKKLLFNFNMWSSAWFARLITGIATYVFGLTPTVIHTTALFIFCLDLIIFYFLLLEIRNYFPNIKQIVSDENKNIWAIITVTLVGISPINVEGLCFASASIPATLVAGTSALTILAFLKGNKQLSLFFLILACGSKQNAVMLPVVTGILYLCKTQNGFNVLKSTNAMIEFVKTHFVFFLVSLFFGYIAILARESTEPLVKVFFPDINGKITSSVSLESVQMFSYFCNALLIYLFKPFIPMWQNPSYLYTTEIATLTKLSPILFGIVLFFVLRSKNRILKYGILIYLVLLLPVLPILRFGDYYAAERYLTGFPVLILYTILTLWVFTALQRTKRSFQIIGTMISWALVLGLLTVNYSKKFNGNNMLGYLCKIKPAEPVYPYNYGLVLFQQQGDTANALIQITKAIDLAEYKDAQREMCLQFKARLLYYTNQFTEVQNICTELINDYNNKIAYIIMINSLVDTKLLENKKKAIGYIDTYLQIFPHKEDDDFVLMKQDILAEIISANSAKKIPATPHQLIQGVSGVVSPNSNFIQIDSSSANNQIMAVTTFTN